MKRLTSVFLILLLVLALGAGLLPASMAAPALDEAIYLRDTARHEPYINGDKNGAFRPNASLTRAELAKIVYSLGTYPAATSSFPDVPATAWYATYVNALAAQGILQGFEDGTFRPNKPVTRTQIVTILQRISGATTEEHASFSDVPKTFWGYEAISVAQSEGWVGGYPDGTFRPNRDVTRAEAVTILNRFLGRIPDHAHISARPYLHFFPDVKQSAWYYDQVMEASVSHLAQHSEGEETWLSSTPYVSDLPDGFYCISKSLYVMQRGAFLHTEQKGTINGIQYTCTGEDGVCTAKTQVLTLASGSLIFLKNETPEASPGGYAAGFYVRNGQLYVVQSGNIVHKQTTGTLNGVEYTCTGESGICTVEDWSKLPLSGIDLKVFTDQLGGNLSCDYSDVASSSWYYSAVAAVTKLGLMSGVSSSVFQPEGTVKQGDMLTAAVRLYEAYFRVDPQPYTETDMQHYQQKAREYGILDGSVNWSADVTRGEVVRCLYRAFHGRELAEQNDVDFIPDVAESSPYYESAMALYRAGIMKGADAQGTANLNATVKRSEFATLISRLVQPDSRLSFSLYNKISKKLTYGKSGTGKYNLEAYQLGDGKNVMVLTFALHGWEDNWDADGEALVYLADKTKEYLEKNYSLLRKGDWTVYILRCVNPDGLHLGTTCNGPGRCTTTYYDENGLLSGEKGIDINRCFDYNFEPHDNERNYNGTEPLACKEARALADFVKKVKGSGRNICIDTHGWLSQIITSSGKGAVYNAFYKRFPDSSYNSLIGASGYFSAWAAYRVGYDSCLFELPSGIASYADFKASNCLSRFRGAIAEILTDYRSPLRTADADADTGAFVLDGN